MERSFHHILMKAYFAMHKSVMAEAQKIGLTSGQPKIKNKIKEELERYSIIRTVAAVERADVVVMMIDALEGVTEAERAELRKMLAEIYDNIAAADRRERQ